MAEITLASFLILLDSHLQAVKTTKSNVRGDCHDILSPTSLNFKQCGRKLTQFCHLALDGVETYLCPILINQKSYNYSQ